MDFSRPIRRLTENEALKLLRPAKPAIPATPNLSTGWLARLIALFSTLIRRS
ncbi:hypothetical protein [Jhaorihella thermophila]|uniref:hypothetical protein n=1 Tax=Jhaorihella thermophila TaxID=488547 RepID=UPI00361ECBC3